MNIAKFVILGLIGSSIFVVIVYSQANRTSFVIEAEQGVLNQGVLTQSDDQASGGSNIQFTDTVVASQWAFEETFNGNPMNPSQALLPKTFDYVATHRTHPTTTNGPWDTFPADHSSMDCAGPTSQHEVGTDHLSNSDNPDQSFYICKDHIMSSMGEVDGYSVTNFFPKQEFDFASGNGIIEFDVNLNGNPGRSWWEVLIAPRDQMKLGAAEDSLPIDETYPKDRIVLSYGHETRRSIRVGKDAIAPDGWYASLDPWDGYSHRYPNDPALTDRRIRRKNRIILNNGRITWQIQKEDGTFDDIAVDIPGGLPFSRGLVMFKTHAYTPEKDGNMNLYTYHWDNIRFNGPRIAPYRTIESSPLVYLASNGDRDLGATETQTINIDNVGNNPVLVGQIQQPKFGETLLSINGAPNIDMSRGTDIDCAAGGWVTTYVPINRSLLRQGANTFRWTVGQREPCTGTFPWRGFTVKAFEIQFDGN